MTQPARISTVPVARNEPTIGPLAQRARRINPDQGRLYVNGNFGECPICFGEINIVSLFPCGHGVCDTCVTSMVTSMVTNDRVQCPLCKRTVPCDDLVHIHLEKGLRDGFKQFMASLGRNQGLVADRVPTGILPIHDPAAPKAYFGFASAPGVAATLIAVPPAAAACQQQKAVVFVIDESGSMRNDLDKAFRALQAALLAMIGGYAAVVVFNSKADLITPPHRVTEESITETMAALYATSATGATQLDLALDLAANCVAEEMRELIAQDASRHSPGSLLLPMGRHRISSLPQKCWVASRVHQSSLSALAITTRTITAMACSCTVRRARRTSPMQAVPKSSSACCLPSSVRSAACKSLPRQARRSTATAGSRQSAQTASTKQPLTLCWVSVSR